VPIFPDKKPPEIPTRIIRLTDFSGGQNSTIAGSLLNDNEAQIAENVSLEQKGTLFPARGRVKRYVSDFSSSPCCGIGGYFKKDGTSYFLVASDTILYNDSPGLSKKWTNQTDFEAVGTAKSVYVSTTKDPGKAVKLGSALGLDGDCEDVSKWSLYQCTSALDPAVKQFSDNSIQATLTDTDGLVYIASSGLTLLGSNYLFSGYLCRDVSAVAHTYKLFEGLDYEVTITEADVSGSGVDYAIVVEEGTGINADTSAVFVSPTLTITLGTDGSGDVDAVGTDVATVVNALAEFSATHTGANAATVVATVGTVAWDSRRFVRLVTLDADGVVLKYSDPVVATSLTKVDLKIAAADVVIAAGFGVHVAGISGESVHMDGLLLMPLTATEYADAGYTSPDFDDVEAVITSSTINTDAEWDAGTHDDTNAESNLLKLAEEVAAFSDVFDTTAQFNEGTVSQGVVAANSVTIERGSFNETDTLTADFDGTHSDTTASSDAVVLADATVTHVADQSTSGSYSAPNIDASHTIGQTFTTGAGVTNISAISGYASVTVAGTLVCTVYTDRYKTTVVGSKSLAVVISSATTRLFTFVPQLSVAENTSYYVEFSTADATAVFRYDTDDPYARGTYYYDGSPNGVRDMMFTTYYITAATTGVYTHGEQSLGAIGEVVSATLSFNKTTPSGTVLTVDYRIYNGSAWGAWVLGAASGVAIIAAETDATNYKVQWRANFSTISTGVSPSLNDVTVAVTGACSYASATWTSPALHVARVHALNVGTLTVEDTTPANTSVTYEYATSADGITYGDWTAYVDSLPVTSYLKIKATLATTDSAVSPSLDSVAVAYSAEYYATGNWISEAIDLSSYVYGSSAVTYVSTLNGGTVTVEVRSRADTLAVWGAWTAQASAEEIASVDNLVQFRVSFTHSDSAQTPTVTSLTYEITPDGVVANWISEPIDVSLATDRSTGKYVLDKLDNGGTLAVVSRSSATLAGTYTEWYAPLPDGSLQHPANDFVQMKVSFSGLHPEVLDLTVTFDSTPTPATLISGMTAGAEYTFTTLKDILVIANGIDAPRKWDGTTVSLLGGTPPVLDCVVTHQNRVWGVEAGTSRVRFSDILDPETWGALNFIDFNPEDGDRITCIERFGQELTVGKNWSMAQVTGNATTNYAVVWADTEQGITGKNASANANKYFCYVAQDGVRFTDFNTSVVVSERMLPTWEGINLRRLNQAAMVYWKNSLIIALPKDGSLYNNTVWIYDFLRNAWIVRTGWSLSGFTVFHQYGEDILLACDSVTGQVYEVMVEDRYDDTTAVEYKYRLKDFHFGAPERYKLFRKVNLDIECTSVANTLTVKLYVDGVVTGTYTTAVPASDKTKIQRMILPPLYDAVIGSTFSMELSGRCGIQGIAIEFSVGGTIPDTEL